MVTLVEDKEETELNHIINLIECIEGVVDVKSVDSGDARTLIDRSRIRQEIKTKLYDVLGD